MTFLALHLIHKFTVSALLYKAINNFEEEEKNAKTKAFIKRIMNRGGCAYINKLKSMPDSYTEWKALKNNLQRKKIMLKKAQHQNVGITTYLQLDKIFLFCMKIWALNSFKSDQDKDPMNKTS